MIKQPSLESGCGIACVANIIGKSYQDTYEIMSDSKCKNKYDDRVTIQQIEKFLGLYENIHTKRSETIEDTVSALLYIRWPDDKRYKHWVLYSDGLYWDPSPQQNEPTDHYLTKPEVIISLFSNHALSKELVLFANEKRI
ncbi:Putative uncharacterized protein [Moritella viscosa]|nr:putative uncharacterized protein [Moritella viscosa]SHO00173.1 Putative uncharacterized protein [Moritella viscosa]SHO20242.1 Putative uncharacterized protein [Moritella viscosa]